MTTQTKDVVKHAINESLSFIPILNPLQQFIATNPLWDKIDLSLYGATSDLNQRTRINYTLSLADYWKLYSNHQISDNDIHQGLTNVLDKLSKVHLNQGISPLDRSLCKQLVFDFMTNQSIQKDILKSIKKDGAKTDNVILVSSQLSSKNKMNKVLSDCQSYLAAYFNPKGLHQEVKAIHDKKHEKMMSCGDYDFFEFWKTLVTISQPKASQIINQHQRQTMDETISSLLRGLNIPSKSYNQYLFDIVWQLKGWFGYIKWQTEHPNNPFVMTRINAKEVIAIWLLSELIWIDNNKLSTHVKRLNFDVMLYQNQADREVQKAWDIYIEELNTTLTSTTMDYIKKTSRSIVISEDSLRWYWHAAFEQAYASPLYQSLLTEKRKARKPLQTSRRRLSDSTTQPIKAQWVFCIDVRSEGFRRHLEKHIGHVTFGFAGFFGVPYKLSKVDDEIRETNQCPALIEPKILVKMISTSQSLYQSSIKEMMGTLKSARKSYLSSFFAYEMLGIWYSLALMFKSYGVQARSLVKEYLSFNRVDEHRSRESKKFTLKIENTALEEKVTLAKSLLSSIGLTNEFASLVVICGHTAKTENNPFQAALDCGACGGNSGLTNAILVTQLLNDVTLREALKASGIDIPKETVFIPACHNTTTDEIHWYEHMFMLDMTHKRLLDDLKKDAHKVRLSLNDERRESLEGNSNLDYRSKDWSEIMPEWGLVNNAAMVIGPRELTANLHLKRRVFLHSYDNDSDPTGSILENILLGPVVVAHWINMQYYFSSIDPDIYGSGDKTIHNLLSNIGVMEGNQSDLKYGLPIQSVFYKNKRIHQPIRLTVFIDADHEKIKKLINKHQTLKSLVDGQWLWLKPLTGASYV